MVIAGSIVMMVVMVTMMMMMNGNVVEDGEKEDAARRRIPASTAMRKRVAMRRNQRMQQACTVKWCKVFTTHRSARHDKHDSGQLLLATPSNTTHPMMFRPTPSF